MNAKQVKDYYAQAKDQNIGDVARELMPDRLTHENGTTLQFDYLHHSSTSQKSLHVDTAKQLFYCFGCGVGGDILQLVEFVKYGKITAHTNGQMPDEHRDARDWLANRRNLPPMSQHGMSLEEIAAAERQHAKNERSLACMEAAVDYWHHRLIHSPNQEPMEFIQKNYAISLDTIKDLKIGYTDNSSYRDSDEKVWPTLFDHLKQEGFTKDEIVSANIAYPTNEDHPTSLRFKFRISFPYISKGRPRYLICRRTDWTEDGLGKYLKLQAHDEHTNKHISPVFTNDILYNEDLLLSRPDAVIITEGVTDCIAGMDRGLPCISPVTTRIANHDWGRLIPRLHNVKNVYICLDNEISMVGTESAVKLASVLVDKGMKAEVVILTPGPTEQAARATLAEKFGITETLTKQEREAFRKSLPKDRREEYDELSDRAKVDLNSWFHQGNTHEDFNNLMAEARNPVEFAISRLPKRIDEEEGDAYLAQISEKLVPIMREIATYPVIHRKPFIEQIIRQTGKAYTKKELTDDIAQYSRDAKERRKAAKKRAERKITAPQGTLQHIVESKLAEFAENNEPVDANAVAEAIWEWLKAHGAHAIILPSGEVILNFEGWTYSITSTGTTDRYTFNAFVNAHTKLLQKQRPDNVITEALTYVIRANAVEIAEFDWSHLDEETPAVFVNLNNKAKEIVRISPNRVEVLKNGNNAHNVFLADSEDMLPIEYVEDQTGEQDRGILDIVYKYIIDAMTCSQNDAWLFFLWTCAYLLLKIVGTRPKWRCEGIPISGKSCGQKILSTLIYGDERLKQISAAAAYSSGTTEPILFIDNLEPDGISKDLLQFLLVTITGIGKAKREAGTNRGIVNERPHCLICSSGVSPLTGKLENVSRTLTVNFDRKDKANRRYSDSFSEFNIKRNIKKHRNAILSWLYRITGRVLAMIQDGALEAAKILIETEFPDHTHSRGIDYLALMYLYNVAMRQDDTISLNKLEPRFKAALKSLDLTAKDISANENQIALAIDLIFQRWEQNCGHQAETENTLSERIRFKNDFGFILDEDGGENAIPYVKASTLLAAFKRIFQLKHMTFDFKSPKELACRLNSDDNTILDAGFIVKPKKGGQNVFKYTIRRTAT